MPRLSSVTFSIFKFALVAIACAACTTPPMKKFEGLRAGMSKTAVVEYAGSPTKTRRWQGKDRWTYEFHDRADDVEVREVVFEHGRAVYIGPKLKPSVTAEEQDKINEAAIAAEAARQDEEDEKRSKHLGIAKIKTGRVDAIDQKIRESYYGIEPDPELEKRKTAPVFVPVD